MSPDKINLGIAEHLKWKRESFGYVRPDGYICNPDFTEDLNAMQLAEYSLIRSHSLCTAGTWRLYLHYLSIVTDEHCPIDATAMQRAEAFMRCIGKWEEVPA